MYRFFLPHYFLIKSPRSFIPGPFRRGDVIHPEHAGSLLGNGQLSQIIAWTALLLSGRKVPAWRIRIRGKFAYIAMTQLLASAGECQGLVPEQINDIWNSRNPFNWSKQKCHQLQPITRELCCNIREASYFLTIHLQDKLVQSSCVLEIETMHQNVDKWHYCLH